MKEFIEIPFGAKDSELRGWEYTIPKGYTASIENGKIIVTKEESEDEKIRKYLLKLAERCPDDSIDFMHEVKKEDVVAWLEKQKPTTNLQNLTWEDIEKIGEFINMVQYENPNGIGAKCLYTDVLERFLDGKQTKQKPQRMVSGKAKEALYDKPAWSEEDELHLEDAIHAAKELYSPNCGGDELVDWLKSLKDRVQPQKEWSEDDEVVLDNIIDFLNSPSTAELCPTLRNDAIAWLKSLKPQPQWKPSEEQIQALEYQVNSTYKGSWQYKESKELLEQLKKL